MKQKLLIAIVLLLGWMPAVFAQETGPSAYAVYDGNGTLTFYYDENMEKRDIEGNQGAIYTGFENVNGIGGAPWANENFNITEVVFNPSFSLCHNITSTCSWFWNFNFLSSIKGLENLNTENVTDMKYMFSNCASLTSLDISSFATQNVTDMSYMFSGCSSLASLNLDNIDTKNVTNMDHLFSHCAFETIELKGFNTSKVENMRRMFTRCENLTELDLTMFNTLNLTNAEYLFDNCGKLTSVDMSSFNTRNVSNMQYMFMSDNLLKTVYVGEGWTVESVKYGTGMFHECVSLVGGDGTVFDEACTDYTKAHAGEGGYLTLRKKTLSPIGVKTVIAFEENDYVNEDETPVDLSNTVINDTYFSIDNTSDAENPDGFYSADEQCIVINKATSNDAMTTVVASELGSNDFTSNFTGMVVEVNGAGSIKVSTQTAGSNRLAVKVGNAEAETFAQTTKGDVTVNYDVTENTYVYIYAVDADNQQQSMSFGTTAVVSDNAVKVYSVTVLPEATAIDNVASTVPVAVIGNVYSLDGKKLSQPQKGVNILRMSDGTTRKVVK